MTAPDPTPLRDRLAAVLRTTPSVLMDTPEERARHAAHPRNHHIGHTYYWGCALCRGEVDTLADAVLGVVQPDLDRQEQHVDELQDKLLSFGDNGGCCCSYDSPGDVCMVHSPTVRKLEAERDQLRAQLADAGLLPVPQSPGATELPCGLGLIRTFDRPARTHHSHTWEPQPGMTPVWCPGTRESPAESPSGDLRGPLPEATATGEISMTPEES